MEKATFAGGSFWGLEDAFASVKGVLSTRVGYTGGHVPNPTHEQVREGNGGHAQAVEVTFDPSQVSYDDLLEVFWRSHDPTQLNRQGADIGPAYRSAIFHHSEKQCQAAQLSRTVLNKMKRFRAPIVTDIQPAGEFYEAEEAHQHFLAKERAEHHIVTPPVFETTWESRRLRTK